MKLHVIQILKKHSYLRNADIEGLLERPKEESMGDYALPCFFLARELKKNPVEIAKDIARNLKLTGEIEKVEAVGPYVNFFVNRKQVAISTLNKVVKEKENYGRMKKKDNKVMVEFSQPNTHKAFHVGHIRGTSFGESLARIKEFCGDSVIRANYSGDTGMHIAKWMWCYTRFHKNEKIENQEEWFAKIYVEAMQKLEDNEEGTREVEEINRKLDEKKDKSLIKLWKETRKKSIDAWKPIYRDLDVKFDRDYFESQVEEAGKSIAKELVKDRLAEESEGATIMNFNSLGLGVWVLLRKDGTVLYSAKDLALARIKFKDYKLNESLVITNAEQNLHFKQLQKTLELMKFPHWKRYNHLGYESVRLPEGKMSSRTGNNILYADFRDELVEEAKKEIDKREKLNVRELEKRALVIAIAAMKYSMLKQDVNKIIVFDKDEALRFEGDTGPYLLYSYARAKSILRKVKTKNKSGKMKIESLDEKEKSLIMKFNDFPQTIGNAYKNNDPSCVAHYAYDLAQRFNEFYHSEKVIGSEREDFRLAIVECFSQVLKNALYLLGIDVLEEM